jgi:hypothetical protein
MITSFVSVNCVVRFALVESIESLLSVTIVDSLDPERRASHLNKHLMARIVLVTSVLQHVPLAALATKLVTRAMDLSTGVGLLLKVALHRNNGAPVPGLFRGVLRELWDGDRLCPAAVAHA